MSIYGLVSIFTIYILQDLKFSLTYEAYGLYNKITYITCDETFVICLCVSVYLFVILDFSPCNESML